MKASRLFLVLSLLVSVASASDRWETLQAIHWIENPTESVAPGRFGELGAYQFRRSTWQMHTKQPFHLATNRAESDKVAVAHYEWIKRGLERNGIEASPFNIALAWNAGLSAVVERRVPSVSRGYASRVVNLVNDLKARQMVAR
ncbi:MAG TPA: hypothetical protein VGD88_10130 [Opitutaceae bacterium]